MPAVFLPRFQILSILASRLMRNSILRKSYFAHRGIIGLLCFFFFGQLSSGQIPKEIRSVRIHGEMELDGRTLMLAQTTKGQNKIRASIEHKKSPTEITIYLLGERLLLEKRLHSKTTIRELSGPDAATHLLDLLAVNPSYHFRPRDGFNLGHPAFKGFSLKIEREELTEAEKGDQAADSLQPITKLQLFDDSRKTDSLIRSIRYLEHFPDGPHGRVPRKIAFTDHTTGQTGIITLHDYDYNAGLLDFLFVPPPVSEGKKE